MALPLSTGLRHTPTGLERLGQAWRSARLPIFVFLVTRVGLLLVAYLSLALMPLNTDPAVAGASGPWRAFPNNLLLDGWARWDSGWYESIAKQGYLNAVIGQAGQRNVAFFPLYPLAMGLLGRVFLGNYTLAGLVISNLAFLVSLILLHSMVRRRFGAAIAYRAVLLFAVYPFAFYFSTVYSEALFCLLVIAAFYCAERDWWWGAGICAMLGGATRPVGIVMLPVLAIFYLERIQFDLRKVRGDILWLTLAGCGPLLYFLYLHMQFGNFALYFEAQRAPGWWLAEGALELLSSTLRQFFSIQGILTGRFPVAFTFNLFMGGLFLITTIAVWRWQGVAYGAFGLLLLVFSLTQWINLGRYMMPFFPAFVMWAQWLKNERVFEGVVVFSTLLLAFWTIAFSHWFWVT
jgi:hypothetical protein